MTCVVYRSRREKKPSIICSLVLSARNTSSFTCDRFADLDLEEFEVQPARYKPDRLEVLSKTTGFTKKEIQFVYRAFKQECPTGMISEETFKSIYAKFFPLGDSSQYAHYVFSTLDREKCGTITFGDFMLGLSVLVKGSLQERLRWAFSLYDVNNDGCITREEMTTVITAIYDLMGASHTEPGVLPDEASKDHVERIFQKLDLNNDGVITVDEFIDYCSMNEDIRSSFAVFDDLW
ncbi:Hypothetical predicted protein [Cloeon dipterum]|uniref:EF-hand domain-containing protein n=1 Tax=Cloeon dipterum TaxID=197152 RepID=A0A8S1E2S1_9INSE|nr:Hypothetical predicted protein [Cloeon dipterum]